MPIASMIPQLKSRLLDHRGHRRYSFQASDVNELQEIRARQRTFHGAYSRTALGALGYAVAILRLFDRKFHRSEFTFKARQVPPI